MLWHRRRLLGPRVLTGRASSGGPTPHHALPPKSRDPNKTDDDEFALREDGIFPTARETPISRRKTVLTARRLLALQHIDRLPVRARRCAHIGARPLQKQRGWLVET